MACPGSAVYSTLFQLEYTIVAQNKTADTTIGVLAVSQFTLLADGPVTIILDSP